jgi:hypothetical protein
MPDKDTIQSLTDSARMVLDSVQQRDSALLADSIAKADSIAYADSVRLHTYSGFEGITASGAPANQPWVFVVLLLLFGIMVLAFVRSISPPQNIFLSFFNNKERNSIFSKTSIDSFEQKFYFLLFSFVSISLYSYLSFYTKGTVFDLVVFFRFLLVFSVFFIAKFFIAKVLEFVFFERSTLKPVYDSYLHVLSIIATVFYLIIIFQIYYKSEIPDFLSTSSLIFLGIGLLLFLAKLVQFFLHKVVVSLYLMLYLCTLEILPVFILIEAFRYVIKNV